MALCEAIDQGLVKRDDVILLTGFGAGLTWAASVLRWSLPLPVPVPTRQMAFWRRLRYRWAQLRSRWRRLWRRVDAHLFQILYDEEGRRKRRKHE
jgi:predicted DCC family thiol-disulfide oxidoreductase YuxK